MAKRPDWRRLLTAGILLAGGMASVDARTIYPEPGSLQLSYDVYKGGFHMLAADLDVEFGAGHYDITAQIRAQGAFAWWTNWRQVVRVTGRFTPWGPTPNAYRSEAYVSGTQRQVAIDYVDGQVADVRRLPLQDEPDRDNVPVSVHRHTIDPVSAILAGVWSMAEGFGCGGRFAVFDGRRRYDVVLADRGEHVLADRPHFVSAATARRCDATFEPVAGFMTEGAEHGRHLKGARAWLASVIDGAPLVPVRIELDGDWGLTVLHLRVAHRNAADSAGLGADERR